MKRIVFNRANFVFFSFLRLIKPETAFCEKIKRESFQKIILKIQSPIASPFF